MDFVLNVDDNEQDGHVYRPLKDPLDDLQDGRAWAVRLSLCGKSNLYK